jgi:hypothetical protein
MTLSIASAQVQNTYFSLNTKKMAYIIRNTVTRSIGSNVTLARLDVMGVSLIPVKAKGRIILGCYKPSFRSSKWFLFLF